MSLVNRVKPNSSLQKTNKRVLVYTEAWGQGGIETFLMNLFRRLQGGSFSFTVFSTWDWNDELDTELAELGIDRWTCFPGRKPGQAERLREGAVAYGELIEKFGCDVSYVNTMNGMGFLWSNMAKKHGVPVRVVHSHNSAYGSGGGSIKAAAHAFGKTVLGHSATACIACSDKAGRYLFGSKPFEIVNNGIDTKQFAFNPEARATLRNNLSIPQDALLFGSVGRIAEAKNPLFQIRTFAEIHRRKPNSHYLMVGDGDMRDQVESLVAELNLESSIIMPGYLSDPASVYSALDCFLMPSLYEGLPMSCMECQCSGCPMVVTDDIAPEALVTDTIEPFSLMEGEARWAEASLSLALPQHERTSYADRVREAGFDADTTAERMAEILGSGR